MSIEFPTAWDQVKVSEGAEIRAGGTELSERRRLLRHSGSSLRDLVDLRDVANADAIEPSARGGLMLGARVRIAELAAHTDVVAHYPGLAEAAGGLATPQIRAVATLSGNLLQATRCWYYRSPEVDCAKRGGEGCPAREGDHLFHACFDVGTCVSVHPSTLGAALWGYDARLHLQSGATLSLADLYQDGSDPTVDHHLPPGEVITGIELPPPASGEHAAYLRSISRARAEWPLVEVMARFVVVQDEIAAAGIAVGGVAPRPMRLAAVEQALVGSRPTQTAFEAAAAKASAGAKPLPMTGYKAELMGPTVLEALERAAERSPVRAPVQAPASKPEAEANDASEKEQQP